MLTQALAQLPETARTRVLVRGDSAAGVHEFINHVHGLGLRYSVGMFASAPILDALAILPRQAWRSAIEADGSAREGAQVAELTRYLRPSRKPWPPGIRVIARRERPHPGAQLRLTDADGWRITLFATNVAGGRIADHELTHRRRARAEDRICALKDSGLRNMPLHDFTANEIWLRTPRPGRRPAHLDPAPGPGRHACPCLGTQTRAAAPARRRCPGRAHRTPTPAAPAPRLALGGDPAHRAPTAEPTHCLTSLPAPTSRTRRPRQTRRTDSASTTSTYASGQPPIQSKSRKIEAGRPVSCPGTAAVHRRTAHRRRRHGRSAHRPAACTGLRRGRAVTGAQCGYLLGHRAGPVLLQRANRPKLHRGAERANLALARYGLPKAVLLARFVPVVRTVINPLAGALRRPVRTITIRQTVGGLGWTTGIILAGHWLGESIPSIDTYLLPIIALIVIASVAPLLVQTYRTRTQPLQS